MKHSDHTASFEYEPYEKYILYNFHPTDWLNEVVKNITVARNHPIVILSGETGTGRQYFIEAAAFKAEKEFHKTECFDIDLEGFEEDGSGIDNFIRHQTEKCSAKQSKDASENLTESFEDARQYIPKSWPTFFGAFFISMVSSPFYKNEPIKKNIINVSAQKHIFTKEPKDALSSFLDALTENRHLIIIINHLESNLVLNRWLRDEASRNKKLTLVIKCAPNVQTREVMPRIEPYAKRFEFLPLSLKSFEDVIDQAWSPNQFPDELYKTLWKQYRSSLKDLALFMRTLVHERILIQDEKENWRLADDGLESEKCADLFSRSFYSPISEFLDSQENFQIKLEQFLFLAALCGENVPLDLMLDYMKLDGDEREDFIEIIDDHLVSNDDSDDPSANGKLILFRDNEYNHPSFSLLDNMLTYSFITPLDYVSIIAHHPNLKNLKNTAESLFFFFQKRLPVASKGIAVLFINLLNHSENDGLREDYASLLSWWIGMDEAKILSDYLVDEMKDGILPADSVWSVFETTEDTWPPYRRKALLDAYGNQPDGIPVDHFESFHLEKIWILYQLAEYDEALPIAQMVHDRFKNSGRDHDHNMGRVCSIIGGILNARGEFNEAMPYFKKELKINLSLYGENNTDTSTAYHNMGVVFRHQNRLDEAFNHFQKALTIHLSIYGENHIETASTYYGMGMVFCQQNRLAEALENTEKALNIYLATYGENHPETARAYHRKGFILGKQQKLNEGIKSLKKAVKIAEQILGSQHPDTQLYKKRLDALEKIKSYHSTAPENQN